MSDLHPRTPEWKKKDERGGEGEERVGAGNRRVQHSPPMPGIRSRSFGHEAAAGAWGYAGAGMTEEQSLISVVLDQRPSKRGRVTSGVAR